MTGSDSDSSGVDANGDRSAKATNCEDQSTGHDNCQSLNGNQRTKSDRIFLTPAHLIFRFCEILDCCAKVDL